MDVATNLLLLVGVGCIIIGVVMLSQEPVTVIKEKESPRVEEPTETVKEQLFDDIKPITRRTDVIWMQNSREQSNQVRPYPVF